jgi:hypothetical protein
MNYTVVPYAHRDPVGQRYGNKGNMSSANTASTVMDATPGPDSPKYQADGGGNGAPAPQRDEGAGES